jgi:hypothetical protein
MKILTYIWNYLKDWRNWLSHTIIGILILVVALYLPVKPIYRVLILLFVISFNILRMKRAKKQGSTKSKMASHSADS